MNKTITLTFGALSLAFAAGCNVDVAETPEAEEIGSNTEAVYCSNDQATAAIQAGMAVAAANEMRRWNPRRDLECSGWNVGVDYITGTTAGTPPDGLVDYPGKCIRGPNTEDGYSQFRVGLSPKAWPRCPNRNCRNMYALLRLQDDSANGMVFGGQALSPGVLRSRLEADWGAQFTCINRPDNGQGDNCPIEDHDLVFQYKATSSATCDNGFDYWYKAWKMGTTNVPLTKPAQLRNLLLWAGHGHNQFLQFYGSGADVKIDPTGGTAEGSSTTSGSCTVVSYNASVNRCGAVYSATNLTGACCQCNGVNKVFAPKSGMVDYYVCQ
jgi:hypothetical protein